MSTAKLPADAEGHYHALGTTRVVQDIVVGEAASTADAIGPGLEVHPSVQRERTAGHLGDFVLLKNLGEGAMGEVYKARQISFNRIVALKVLFPHVASNPKLVERFYREARVAGKLDHPNLVSGYEVGEDVITGRHYFAMEYVPGKSLQMVLAALGRLCVADALYLVLRVACGLEYAHERGLVHRDVKPENIFVTRKGEVKLGDLGMVKQLDNEMSLTQTGYAVGTPWYMPLEQARNAKNADARCDIYALGCVLYALLTGQPPFTGKTLIEVVQAKEAGTFPPARQVNGEVSERLDTLIAKMVARQPQDRYQSCAEVIRDLQRLGLASTLLSFLPPLEGPVSDKRSTALPETVGPSEATPIPGTVRSRKGPDIWYVRYKTPAGQPVQRKLTTPQVLAMIESAHYDPATRASRNPSEGFYTLLTYREFEPAIRDRLTRSGADRQSFRSRREHSQSEVDKHKGGPRDEVPVTPGRAWLRIGLFGGSIAVASGAAYLLVRWLISLAGT